MIAKNPALSLISFLAWVPWEMRYKILIKLGRLQCKRFRMPDNLLTKSIKLISLDVMPDTWWHYIAPFIHHYSPLPLFPNVGMDGSSRGFPWLCTIRKSRVTFPIAKALINKMLLVSQILTYFSVIVQPEESLVTIFLVDESKMAKK